VLSTRSSKQILKAKAVNDGVPEVKMLLAADPERKIPW